MNRTEMKLLACRKERWKQASRARQARRMKFDIFVNGQIALLGLFLVLIVRIKISEYIIAHCGNIYL